jgi:hypothetical protein
MVPIQRAEIRADAPFAWLLALQTHLCVGFVMLFLDKGSFQMIATLDVVFQPTIYLAVLGVSFIVVLARLLYGGDGALHFIWLLLYTTFTLGVAIAYKVCAGISIPTVFMYLLLGIASPVLYRHSRLMFSAAGVAILVNSAYSLCQMLTVIGVIDPYGLPVIPMAFQNAEGGITFDVRRASGFYFQPLAAAAIFGFSALIYWRLHRHTGWAFYGVIHAASLLGLLLSQSWAATMVVFLFYLLLGGWRLRMTILAFGTGIAAYALGNDTLQAAIAYLVDEKMSNSGSVKLGLVLKHVTYFLNNPQTFLMGGVFDAGIPFTENTFISLCYQFGVVAAVLLPALILHQSLKNISRARAEQNPHSPRAVVDLNLVMLFPCVLMLFQNSALVPPVIVLLVLLLAWNNGDARSFAWADVEK